MGPLTQSASTSGQSIIAKIRIDQNLPRSLRLTRRNTRRAHRLRCLHRFRSSSSVVNPQAQPPAPWIFRDSRPLRPPSAPWADRVQGRVTVAHDPDGSHPSRHTHSLKHTSSLDFIRPNKRDPNLPTKNPAAERLRRD